MCLWHAPASFPPLALGEQEMPSGSSPMAPVAELVWVSAVGCGDLGFDQGPDTCLNIDRFPDQRNRNLKALEKHIQESISYPLVKA